MERGVSKENDSGKGFFFFFVFVLWHMNIRRLFSAETCRRITGRIRSFKPFPRIFVRK